MALHQTSTRSGRYTKQPTGYHAFIPAALPPNPPITFDDVFLDVLSRADRAVGRLDGCAETLPNSELFVFMYIRKEAAKYVASRFNEQAIWQNSFRLLVS